MLDEELDSQVAEYNDFKNIQDQVDEYSSQIQKLISSSNEYHQNKTIATSQTIQSTEDEIEFLESIEYDSGFSCSNHKNNIAVRMAIRKSPSLTRMLISLSRFASSVRMSTFKSRDFILKKVRLQIENTTRWSSSF